MPSTVKYHINKTQGEELLLPCIECAGRTAHKVLASADIRGNEDYADGNSFSWAIDNQIVQCLGCKAVSFRKASWDDADWDPANEKNYNVNETLYPSRVEGVKCLGDDTYYLPTNVRRIYDETLMTLSNQAPVLAGIGLRALLEMVCKEKNATGDNLLKKIESLVDTRVLTPENAAILHKIRALGNDAAHEASPHSDEQLRLAMDIIEHLLKYVYILPKQVASVFNE